MTLMNIRETRAGKEAFLFRLIAGLPLAMFGTMHLVGAAPMKPILVAANIPLPDINALIAPVAEVLASVLLLSGAFARLGSLLAAGTMSVALYSHAVADWQDEPNPLIAAAVLACSLYILWRGAGAWSLDAKAQAEG